MSTKADAPAGEKTPIKTVPADIRARALGMRVIPPTPEEKAKKDAEDKAKLDAEKAAGEKAAKEKEAADAEASEKAEKGKKKAPKLGPKLPDPAPASTDQINRSELSETVRKLLPEITGKQTSASPALPPEMQEDVELARFAEQNGGERYAGFEKKVTQYFSDHEALMAEKAKELGGKNSAEMREYLQSDEYKQWGAERRPGFLPGDRKKFNEERIAARAREETRREMAPKLDEIERKQLEIKHAPEIQQHVTRAVHQVILVDPSPEAERDPALTAFVKDPIKFGEAHPEEARIIAQTTSEYIGRIEEVFRVDRGIAKIDPKSVPAQKWINEYIGRSDAALREKYPNGLEMQDGKILVDAETYTKHKLDRDPRYRTVNAEELVGMIAAEANAEVLGKLRQRRDGVSKSIYSRTAKETPPPEKKEGEELEGDSNGDSPAAPSSRMPNGKSTPPAKRESLAKKYA